MPAHETVHCPRCKTAFECRVGSILQCQCQAVTLSEEEREYIGQHYSGCLCANCLHQVKTTYKQEKFRQRLQKIFSLFGKR
jgi:hypothetical protein